jgi:hypothetical protein
LSIALLLAPTHLSPAIPGAPTPYSSPEDSTANNDLTMFQTSVLATLSASASKDDLTLRISQLTTTITPLLTKAPYLLDTLNKGSNVLTSFISSIKTIAAGLPSSDARQSFINQQANSLNTQLNAITKRITDQQTIANNLQTTRNLPAETSFQNKISQLSRWLNDIKGDTLEQTKLLFVNDLGDLLTYAQTKGASEQTQIRSLIANTLGKFKGFYTLDQQSLSPIFQQLSQLQTKATAPVVPAASAAPAAAAAPTPAAATTAPAPTTIATTQLSQIQIKIEDIKKQKLLNEKLIASKELLGMIKETTFRDERQSIFNLFKDIEAGFLQMTKPDIEALLSFLKDNLKANTFMADFYKDIDNLITELAEAKDHAGDTGTLLASIKTNIASFSTNASTALEAALYAFKLLEAGKLPPEEQKIEQPAAPAAAPTAPSTPTPAPGADTTPPAPAQPTPTVATAQPAQQPPATPPSPTSAPATPVPPTATLPTVIPVAPGIPLPEPLPVAG